MCTIAKKFDQRNYKVSSLHSRPKSRTKCARIFLFHRSSRNGKFWNFNFKHVWSELNLWLFYSYFWMMQKWKILLHATRSNIFWSSFLSDWRKMIVWDMLKISHIYHFVAKNVILWGPMICPLFSPKLLISK